MEPNSHLLVNGSPDVRRRFLDWGVFHVEQEYLEVWRRFSKALRQRNAALRQGRIDVIDSIDEILSPLGSQLSLLRESYNESISRKTRTIVSGLSTGLSDITLEYQNGWGSGPYREALEKWRERDMERGATSQGPHRADLVLMNNRLADVARALRLSRAMMRTIKQNLFWAFFYNSVGLPVAAGVLYAFGGPLLSPMLASVAMAFSSVSVVANALRLKRFERTSPAVASLTKE